MAVFPQLATGAGALYPVVRRKRARTVVNELDDGRTVAYSDADAGRKEWELRASALTEGEWEAVEALFGTVKGRLETFTFLDPAGNLLARSEEFGDPVWTNGALIQLTPGMADPLGTTRATHVVNAGAAVGSVAQTIPAPGWYTYAMSVWARSAGGASVTLRATAGAGNATQTLTLSAAWQRHWLGVALGLAEASVTFAVDVPAAAALDLFGMQVEAQPGVSDYKKTSAQGGVYLKARFSADELVVRALGTDVYEAGVGIVA
jgi:hypothetical protein